MTTAKIKTKNTAKTVAVGATSAKAKNVVKIKEIFSSIQGEGLYIGQKHLFIRFCACNLNCKYCDTDFKTGAKEYSPLDLYKKIENEKNCKMLALTGGEPLLEVEFLKDFLSSYKNKIKQKIYLETNGTLPRHLAEIIDFIDVVAMDIKLESATGQKNNFEINEEFLKIAKNQQPSKGGKRAKNAEVFIKVVFDKNIKDDEINKVCKIAEKYAVTLVLQPKMPLDAGLNLAEIFEKFSAESANNQDIRLIAQNHKFLNLP